MKVKMSTSSANLLFSCWNLKYFKRIHHSPWTRRFTRLAFHIYKICTYESHLLVKMSICGHFASPHAPCVLMWDRQFWRETWHCAPFCKMAVVWHVIFLIVSMIHDSWSTKLLQIGLCHTKSTYLMDMNINLISSWVPEKKSF